MSELSEQELAGRLGERRTALLAQCTPASTPDDSAALPVHIAHWGTSGVQVLLVHGGVQGGLGGGPASFAGQRPLSDRGWRLDLIDRPGFGDSPSRGVDDMEADGELVAERLVEPVHLIGHSYGGAVALLAAGRRSDVVVSLTMIEPALQALVALDPPGMADPQVRAAVRTAIDPILGSETPSDVARTFALRLGTERDGTPNQASADLHRDRAQATRLGCSLLRARMASPASLAAAADAVRHAATPVLVISGGYSPDQDVLGRVVARILGGRHEIVPAPNHFVQLANPNRFNDLVDSFMRNGADSR